MSSTSPTDMCFRTKLLSLLQNLTLCLVVIGCEAPPALFESRKVYVIEEADFGGQESRESRKGGRDIPVAKWSVHSGLVESPFGDRGFIDVRGFSLGSFARDPRSGRIFLVPKEAQ